MDYLQELQVYDRLRGTRINIDALEIITEGFRCVFEMEKRDDTIRNNI